MANSELDISTAAVQKVANAIDFCRQTNCTVDECRAARMLRALAQRRDVLEQAQTWQPIETAPKDGSFVLLWWRAELGSCTVDFWACGQWLEFGDGSKGWCGESFHASEPKSWTRLLGEHPTHWTPLPEPPK